MAGLNKNIFSNFMEEFDQRPPPSYRNGDLYTGFKEQENIGVSCKQEGGGGGGEGGAVAEMEFVTDSFGIQGPSLTERRAGRVGFDAPAINTGGTVRVADDFRSSSLEIRAPYLTIPSGLSPTTLLDSPMFLSNMRDQPSPTTGSFPSVQAPEKSKSLEGTNPRSTDLKPRLEPIPFSFPSRGNQPGSTMDLHQFLPSMETLVGYPQGSNLSSIKGSTDDVDTYHKLSDLCRGNDHSPPPDRSQDEETRGETSSIALGGLAEDGYNWRKYGQKQVKGSEYPRSYYKCTNLNCQVKKKVERNLEGQVTEIIYKGTHNHQKPLPIRRPGFPSSSSNEFQVEGHDWRNANDLEGAPPASVAELDVSSTMSNDEDEDHVAHGSTSLGCDGEDEESEAKKRKLDVCATEMSASSRAAREQKVVVQTTSEVDILDDGYRWRKYGQKVVKGNPNPRSYYKCTHPSCTVRKHVERASHDLKAVITTYEGKHNHEVPVSRSSGGGPTGSAAPPAPAAPSAAAQPSRLQNSFSRLHTHGLVAGFGLHGKEPIRPAATNFSFALGPRGLPMPNLVMAGYRPMALLPDNAYLGQHRAAEGLLVPKGEPKEEPVPGNGASVFYRP